MVSVVGVYQLVFDQLAYLDREVARGAQVLALARWVEEGESSSAYFSRLEKKRCADRKISALREADGSITSSPEGLCRYFASFYSSLFYASPTNGAAQESLLSHVTSTLASQQAASCEGMLSVDECDRALSVMARRKALGYSSSRCRGPDVWDTWLVHWRTCGPLMSRCVLFLIFRLSGGHSLSRSRRRPLIEWIGTLCCLL